MDVVNDWFSLFDGVTSTVATVAWLAKTIAETRRSRRSNGETHRIKKF